MSSPINFFFTDDNNVTHVIYYAHIVRCTHDSRGCMTLHLSDGMTYSFDAAQTPLIVDKLKLMF